MALVALLVLACSGGDDAPRPPTDETDAAPAGTADTGVADLAFTAGPTLTENPLAGLTAWLDVATTAPTSLALTVTVGAGTWTLESPLADTHRVLILGLRAETDVEVGVVATDAAGRRVEGSATLRAGPLPDAITPLTVVTADPARMEPGVTLVAESEGYVFLVDADGQPCWYLPYDGTVREVGLWPGPHLGIVGARQQIDEVDLSGALVRRLGSERAQPPRVTVDVFATHHDARLLANGNVLSLDVERRWMLHPSSESDASAPWAEVWVAGDVVVELAPDGTTTGRWPLLDLLDPERIGYGSVTGDFWEDFLDWSGDDVHDWAHANSVSHDPVSDTILVSLRHQDAVVGFSRSTGELRWILGNPAQWEPPWDAFLLSPDPEPADFRWNWHQHAAQWTPSGTIVMFDNGNNGVPAWFPPRPGRLSRALEVRVDPAAKTFEVVWSWGDEVGLFAPSLGDADVLPRTDNVLVTFGNSEDPYATAKLFEVARDGTIVWRAESIPGATWFRSGRWTGVIPGPGR